LDAKVLAARKQRLGRKSELALALAARLESTVRPEHYSQTPDETRNAVKRMISGESGVSGRDLANLQ
jgi:hypothetical protein